MLANYVKHKIPEVRFLLWFLLGSIVLQVRLASGVLSVLKLVVNDLFKNLTGVREQS